MSVNVPTADFVTSSLVGGINNSVDTFTIAAGLTIPATNGALQIDYNSAIAVGTSSGPETILYATYTTDTGVVAGVTRGSGGTTAVSHANLAAVQCGDSSVYYGALSALYDGWITANETWTRTADTTFTISGDFTGIYSVGDKLRTTGYKYFYITALSFGGGTTTVTITGGSDYVLATSPATRWYSKSSNPVGFPAWFNWVPTWAGFSSAPTLNFSRFSINGRMCTIEQDVNAAGASNATTMTLTVPVAPAKSCNNMGFVASYDNNTTQTSHGHLVCTAGSTTVSAFKLWNQAAWTNTGNKYIWMPAISYEI